MQDLKLNQFSSYLANQKMVVYPCNAQELNDILLFLSEHELTEFILFWDEAYLHASDVKQVSEQLPATAYLIDVSGSYSVVVKAIERLSEVSILITGISSIKQRLLAMLKGLTIVSYFRCPVTFVNSVKHNLSHAFASTFKPLRPLSQFYAHHFICPNQAVINQLKNRFKDMADYIPCEPYNLMKIKKSLSVKRYCGEDVTVFLTGAHEYHNDQQAHVAQLAQIKELANTKCKLLIKVHPRDSREHYKPFLSDSVKFEDDVYTHIANKNAVFLSNFSFMNIELAYMGGESIFLCDSYVYEKYRFWYDLYRIKPCLSIAEFKEAKNNNLTLGYSHFYNG